MPAFWDGLCAGRSALGPIARFPADDLDPRVAAEVRDVPEDDPDRAGAMLLRAADEARREARLDGAVDLGRVGVVVGTTLGGMQIFERWVAGERPADLGRVPYYAPAARLARTVGCGGPVATPQLACASGTEAIALAADWIRRGRA
ncbi:MAG TPA: beta-ketoacyl synthase N-terminal-like domain-containing protein, partial [Candidatus Binatia bacterium]|nr:beta-ketoacyl synthase N-terminal-like domain-containing protein [Candidatus Binatia bacterium]